jgi:hypothetical protein
MDHDSAGCRLADCTWGTGDTMIGTQPTRDEHGRWLPGNGGRKRGSKNKTSLATLKAVQDLSSEAVAQLKERLRAGDMGAIKLILSYTLPNGGRVIELDSTDPHAISDAAMMGEISPDEAARLAQAVKTSGDAAELRELKQQVDELEALIASMRK